MTIWVVELIVQINHGHYCVVILIYCPFEYKYILRDTDRLRLYLEFEALKTKSMLCQLVVKSIIKHLDLILRFVH